MSDNGWIKIHRKIMKSVIWSDPLRLKAWVHILLSANHEDKEFFFGGSLVKCKKGQFITSIRKLSIEWGCSAKTVRKIINQLAELEMIEYSSEIGRYTTLSVINYGVYQDRGHTKEHIEGHIEGHTEGHTEEHIEVTQTRTNKNNKEIEEEIDPIFLPEPDDLSEDETPSFWKDDGGDEE